MGNGAKAAQRRERHANGKGDKGPTSRLKVNEAAKSIICQTCRQTFLLTTRTPALEEHAQNKHSRTLAECFPGHSGK
ncbi:At2g23090 like protein [Scleroderma yunnanense]